MKRLILGGYTKITMARLLENSFQPLFRLKSSRFSELILKIHFVASETWMLLNSHYYTAIPVPNTWKVKSPDIAMILDHQF